MLAAALMIVAASSNLGGADEGHNIVVGDNEGSASDTSLREVATVRWARVLDAATPTALAILAPLNGDQSDATVSVDDASQVGEGEVASHDVSITLEEGDVYTVQITFYTCPPYCGLMADGNPVYEGAAACGGAFRNGQLFTIEKDPTLRTYVCADRGLGPWRWVDIFWADAADGRAWITQIGSYGTVILR